MAMATAQTLYWLLVIAVVAAAFGSSTSRRRRRLSMLKTEVTRASHGARNTTKPTPVVDHFLDEDMLVDEGNSLEALSYSDGFPTSPPSNTPAPFRAAGLYNKNSRAWRQSGSQAPAAGGDSAKDAKSSNTDAKKTEGEKPDSSTPSKAETPAVSLLVNKTEAATTPRDAASENVSSSVVDHFPDEDMLVDENNPLERLSYSSANPTSPPANTPAPFRAAGLYNKDSRSWRQSGSKGAGASSAADSSSTSDAKAQKATSKTDAEPKDAAKAAPAVSLLVLKTEASSSSGGAPAGTESSAVVDPFLDQGLLSDKNNPLEELSYSKSFPTSPPQNTPAPFRAAGLYNKGGRAWRQSQREAAQGSSAGGESKTDAPKTAATSKDKPKKAVSILESGSAAASIEISSSASGAPDVTKAAVDSSTATTLQASPPASASLLQLQDDRGPWEWLKGFFGGSKHTAPHNTTSGVSEITSGEQLHGQVIAVPLQAQLLELQKARRAAPGTTELHTDASH